MGANANDRQVGGTHYAAEYQHWDFVLDAKLTYLEGQFTKYLDRHAKKAGRQDLEKAGHYLQKLIEATREGRHTNGAWRLAYGTTPLARYIAARPSLTPAEKRMLGILYTWRNTRDLAEIQGILSVFTSEVYPQ